MSPIDMRERHGRDHAALSEEESALLSGSTVAVVGCGGLGGGVIESLTRVGVGHLVLIDADVFEPSNLNRQILCRECDLGRPKALRAQEHVREVDGSIRVEAHVVMLDEDNAHELLAGCDCVVDALDSVSSRLTLAKACYELGVPVVYGAIAGWYGQVAVVYPGDLLYATVYGSVEEDPAHARTVEKQLGNLAFTAACVASFQAAETVKVLVGRGETLRGRILMIDLLDGSCESM